MREDLPPHERSIRSATCRITKFGLWHLSQAATIKPMFRWGILSGVTLVLWFVSLALGENLNPGRPCMFDPERPDVPNCIQTDHSGGLFVSSNYLRQLSFDRFGLAVVYSRQEGWMYVNRKGRVVVSGVAAVDNWADGFHDGLVRIIKNGKYGFANQRGTVVISPVYDGALNFENRIAEVCRGCGCDDHHAEHCTLVGGEWFRIDTHGRVLAHPATKPSTPAVTAPDD